MFKRIAFLSVLTVSILSGCANIPGNDIAFLDRRAAVGDDASALVSRLENKGFSRKKELSKSDGKSLNFETLEYKYRDVASLADQAQANLGFAELSGEPVGELSCFSRSYSFLLATGQRLVCLTSDERGLITWRQAGWFGASF